MARSRTTTREKLEGGYERAVVLVKIGCRRASDLYGRRQLLPPPQRNACSYRHWIVSLDSNAISDMCRGKPKVLIIVFIVFRVSASRDNGSSIDRKNRGHR